MSDNSAMLQLMSHMRRHLGIVDEKPAARDPDNVVCVPATQMRRPSQPSESGPWEWSDDLGAWQRPEQYDQLAWIDALKRPAVRPPEHPGEDASAWRLLVHLVRLWAWRRRERKAAAEATPVRRTICDAPINARRAAKERQ